MIIYYIGDNILNQDEFILNTKAYTWVLTFSHFNLGKKYLVLREFGLIY